MECDKCEGCGQTTPDGEYSWNKAIYSNNPLTKIAIDTNFYCPIVCQKCNGTGVMEESNDIGRVIETNEGRTTQDVPTN